MTKPILLAVDDDSDVLNAIARDLRTKYGRDFRVLRAESGKAALELLRELKERGSPVALLLSDQRMPGMDGVTFLSQAMEDFPKAKRALITAYADTEAAINAINRSQVHYYLVKPWDPPEEKLFPVLDDMLEEWRASYRPGYGGLRVVGDRWSARCHTVRDFLARNQKLWIAPLTTIQSESATCPRSNMCSPGSSVILSPCSQSQSSSSSGRPSRMSNGRNSFFVKLMCEPSSA